MSRALTVKGPIRGKSPAWEKGELSVAAALWSLHTLLHTTGVGCYNMVFTFRLFLLTKQNNFFARTNIHD